MRSGNRLEIRAGSRSRSTTPARRRGAPLEPSPWLPDVRWWRPMDMELGPKGNLYLLEYRTASSPAARTPRCSGSTTLRAGARRSRTSTSTGSRADPADRELSPASARRTRREPDHLRARLHHDGTVDATGVTATHTYDDPGALTAKLTVRDETGRSGFENVLIVAGNTRPQFSASGHDPQNGPLIYEWDFGDGGGSFNQSREHTYTEAGTYTATVTVTDPQGKTGTDTVEVVVSPEGNEAPIVRAIADPRSGDRAARRRVQRAGDRPDGDSDEILYWWDFGDGGADAFGRRGGVHLPDAGDVHGDGDGDRQRRGVRHRRGGGRGRRPAGEQAAGGASSRRRRGPARRRCG